MLHASDPHKADQHAAPMSRIEDPVQAPSACLHVDLSPSFVFLSLFRFACQLRLDLNVRILIPCLQPCPTKPGKWSRSGLRDLQSSAHFVLLQRQDILAKHMNSSDRTKS